MKNILVPTDFSSASKNAIDYAVEMSKLTKAKLILLHVYHVPVMSAEAPLVLPSLDEIEKDGLKNLEEISKNIALKAGNEIKIECKCVCGFAVEEINTLAQEENVDLIIMGMRGVGYLAEKLIGSVTTSIIQKSKCPVLAIEAHIKFKAIKKVVLATDYNKIENKSIFNALKKFITLFNGQLYILNVVKELSEVPSKSEAVEGVKLDHRLEGINHSFHSIENEDVVAGINEFVEGMDSDLVVMIPRNHNLIWNIFNESSTKKMAFHTHVPLLVLHE